MNYRYYICDVFTERRFGGNQLAVLPQAEGNAAATYSDDVTIHRMPAQQNAIRGKEQLRAVYRERFASPSLHAEILSRIVLGNKVIDHERIVGIREHPVEALAIYEVAGGLIRAVWFFYPEGSSL